MKMPRWMTKVMPWLAVLTAAGAFNWLLIGLMDFNLVEWLVELLPMWFSWLERTIYVLAGVGGLLALWKIVK